MLLHGGLTGYTISLTSISFSRRSTALSNRRRRATSRLVTVLAGRHARIFKIISQKKICAAVHQRLPKAVVRIFRYAVAQKLGELLWLHGVFLLTRSEICRCVSPKCLIEVSESLEPARSCSSHMMGHMTCIN